MLECTFYKFYSINTVDNKLEGLEVVPNELYALALIYSKVDHDT